MSSALHFVVVGFSGVTRAQSITLGGNGGPLNTELDLNKIMAAGALLQASGCFRR